ncbi:hypothetical protein AVEN_259466-1 [Araneus ventricosus]|uniref:Uncharacterized protein n=1 Tax=Araneus ventricosus TaxID=182803 RepID=A0A4Y2I348_ARAVE|nr:hypothetical protein AVEN_259466-1 [Araneus ventricosus]
MMRANNLGVFEQPLHRPTSLHLVGCYRGNHPGALPNLGISGATDDRHNFFCSTFDNFPPSSLICSLCVLNSASFKRLGDLMAISFRSRHFVIGCEPDI